MRRVSGQLFYGAVKTMPDSSTEYRFRFYERVRITSDHPELAPVRGELAAVLGRSARGTRPGYAVSVYATGECWDVSEDDLKATGEFDSRETFYAGETMRVGVKPDGSGDALKPLDGGAP